MRYTDAIKALKSSASGIAALFGSANSRASNFMQLFTGDQYAQYPHKDAKKLLAYYDQSPWVRANVSKIAEGVAGVAWYLENAAGDRIDEHPALDFLAAGNPKLRGRAARKATVAQVLLAGESYWIVGRDASGAPIEYAPVPTHWVTQSPTNTEPYYTVQPRTDLTTRVHQDDVVVFRDPSPVDPYQRGGSITGAAAREISSDEAAAEYLDTFFKNRARPDLIVSGTEENPIPEDSLPRFEQVWRERHGKGRSGRPFFSTNPLNIHEMGAGLRENDVSDIRDGLKASLSEVYALPPELIGRLDNSNRATIDSADYLFSLHVVTPLLTWFGDTVSPYLQANFDMDGLTLCFVSPVKEDRATLAPIMTAFRENFTGNEVRQLAGLKPKDGLDELMKPAASPFASAFGGPPDPTETPAEDATDTEPEDDAEDEADAKPKSKAAPIITREMSLDDIIRVSTAHNDPLAIAEASKLFDALYRRLLETYGAELLAQLGTEASFQINARVANWLANRGSTLIKGLNDTTQKYLEDALLDGATTSKTAREIIDAVDDLFAEMADARTSTVGTTEATAITGFGSQAAGEQGGFERKEWLTSQDQVVRSTHAAMDGQRVGMREAFVSPSGASAEHPGAFGDPAEDINCRCAMRPLVEGERAFSAAHTRSFTAWHGRALDATAAAVEIATRRLFDIQRKMVLTQLKKSLRVE